MPAIDGYVRGEPCHFMWREFVGDARAAIEAMRKPTDAMLDAMNDVDIDCGGEDRIYPSIADLQTLWIVGISAALKEENS